MIVFKHYFKIVKQFSVVIMMYLFIFAIFALASSGTNTTDVFSVNKPKVVVINHDNSKLIDTFIKYVNNNSEIIDIKENEINDSLFYREIDYVITIPENFTESFIDNKDAKIETKKVPDSYNSTYVEMLFNRFFNITRVYLGIGMSEEYISNIILNDLNLTSDVEMVSNNQTDIEKIKYFYNFTNYTILATCIFIVGMLMTIFNDKNIKRRNMVSPYSITRFDKELFIGNACITFLVWLMYTILGIILYKESMFSNNGILMMLNSLVFSFTALSISFLVGNLVKNKEAQSGIVNVLALGSSFICGAFVPQEMLGGVVLTIGKFLPSYWFIKNNNDIALLSNFNLENLNPIFINMVIILVFGIVLFIVTSIINSKKMKNIS